jgi:hypothetical protein
MHQVLTSLAMFQCAPDHEVLHGNGPVSQVETSPGIFSVYRAYLAMTVHKIFAADTRCKGAKKNCPNCGRIVQIRATAHARDSSGAVFPGEF